MNGLSDLNTFLASDGIVKVWSADTMEHVVTLTGGHTLGISDLSWSKESKYLATASDDKTIALWDVAAGTKIKSLIGHTNYVFTLDFSPASDQMLASGSFDETIRLWDVRTGKTLRTLPSHSDPVSSVNYSFDGSMLVSGSYDGLIRLWDASTGQCLKTIMGEGNSAVPV